MTLTAEDRIKFAAHCEEEARSYAALAAQTEHLPGGLALGLPLRRKAAAFAIVARHLVGGEEQAITTQCAANGGTSK